MPDLDVGDSFSKRCVLGGDQEIKIKEWVKLWQHPTEKRARNVCPISLKAKKFTFDMTDFEEWLGTHTAVKKNPEDQSKAIERLFQMLDFDSKGGPHGVLCRMMTARTLVQLRRLPLMSDEYSWTRTSMYALSHYAQFLVMDCRRQSPPWKNTREALEQFDADELVAYRSATQAEKNKQSARRRKKDTKRLQEFPKRSAVKKAVRQAMVDLATTVH